ncbi:MAG: Cupredoxin-like domain [Actinomycetota bacterium]|nr:Cupredoxin-like domain [Actinomycetota bacterium]
MGAIGAGVLLLLGGCSADASQEGPVVVLRIEHSRFIPAHLEVEPGSTVTFVVANGDPIDHELIIGD